MSQTATRARRSAQKPSTKRRPARASGRALETNRHRPTLVGRAAHAAGRTLTAGAGKAVRRAGRAAAERAVPAAGDAVRGVAERVRLAGRHALETRPPRLPIQQAVDVAVPLEVAWDEWMQFPCLPEGAHRAIDIEREDDRLFGRLVGGARVRDWEAEIVEERVDESFGWRSLEGSTCAGLATFHRLDDRLTHIELNLDARPDGMPDAIARALHLADRRVAADLRRFKAFVEALDPDDYDLAEPEADEDVPDE